VVVVVATPPLAAADHCHPTIGFNHQEPRPGASRRKGGSLRSTKEPLILQPSRTRSLYLYCREKWDTGKKLLLLYFILCQSYNCGFAFSSLDATVSNRLHILFVTKIGCLISVCYYAIGYFDQAWEIVMICTSLHNLYIIAIIFIFGSFIKYRKSIFNIKLQKNKTSVIISNACFEGFLSTILIFQQNAFYKAFTFM